MKVKEIGVIGAGTMGHGISLVAAKAGFNVIIRDIKDEFVQKGLSKIERFLDKSIEKGKMTKDEKKQILSKIKGTTKLEDLKNVDLVVEAIFENVEVKKDLFKNLDKICKKETLFATNTSTIPITVNVSCILVILLPMGSVKPNSFAKV